jgi:hypothetical protein
VLGIALLAPALLATQAAAPVVVSAPPETVADFLAQADALVAMGSDAAATSPQGEAIRTGIQQAALAYRASLAQAAERGDPPPSCPPPPGQAQLSLGDLIGLFTAFPQANRSMPLATAFALVMTLQFPCSGAPQ